MKFYKIISILLFLLVSAGVFSQEIATAPERTPEQEAVKQTEKMQQELHLTTEQARQIHEVNLKYARARQVSNTRIEAIQRIKDKEVELSRILNQQQQSILQNKRYERSTFQSAEDRQTISTLPTDNQNQLNRSANTGSVQRSELTSGAKRQAISTRPSTIENSRSTYRSSTESRSNSVRSATPSGNTVHRSSSNQGSMRSNPTPSSPSNSGRR